MNNFYNKISSRIEDLILAIVALGILVVSIEYIQFYLDHRESNLDTAGFAQRIVLFFAVILFTSYYFLAYSAYFCRKDVDHTFTYLSPTRLTVMYIMELVQVTIAALPYAILLIGTLSSAPDEFNNYQSNQLVSLEISLEQMNLLFLIMMTWHLVVWVWYWVAHGGAWSRKLHFFYCMVYLLLTIKSHLMMDRFSSSTAIVWLYIFLYLALVISLYMSKGRRDIQKAIDAHREAQDRIA